MKNYLSNLFTKKDQGDPEKLELEASWSVHAAQLDRLLVLQLSKQGNLQRAESYLNQVLEVDTEKLTFLSDELRLLEAYVSLYASSCANPIYTRFSAKMEEDSPLEVAPFILFPLVQNALHFGYNTTEKFPMKVKITQIGQSVKLEISNRVNPYIQNQEEEAIVQYFKSRLNLLYPDKHTLFVNSNGNLYKCTLIVTF